MTNSVFKKLSAAVYSLETLLEKLWQFVTRSVLKDENVKKIYNHIVHSHNFMLKVFLS